MGARVPLEGKVAIVTGAGRGIGRAIVERFSRDGAAVVATQRTVHEGEELRDQIRASGGQIEFIPADIRKPAELQAVVGGCVESFGQLDILCNNAATGLLKSVVASSDDDYDLIFDTNVRSIFAACRFAIPHMLDSGSGSIVNIGSVAAYLGFEDDAAYCASKGAVLALTKQMAIDYSRRGIRVNCISPGFIETDQLRTYLSSHPDPASAKEATVRLHPIGRVGRPEEVAAAASFLASDDASFITGESLAVDGGLGAW